MNMLFALTATEPNVALPIIITVVLAAVLGIVIVLVANAFALPEDPRFDEIRGILPGANCGACGYSGCDGYARAMTDGATTDCTLCTVGGANVAFDLAAALGEAEPDFTAQVAQVMCQGTTDFTRKRYEYAGTMSCTAAHGLFSGPNSCTYGCMGFGDCVAACNYGAITIENGIAVIDRDLCTACGLCVKACPKNLIFVIPKRLNTYAVRCRNKWPGAQTRKNCSIGCIGCRKCFKVCEDDAITMDGPLAVIDQAKCTQCGKCRVACPTGAIAQGLTPIQEVLVSAPRSHEKDAIA